MKATCEPRVEPLRHYLAGPMTGRPQFNYPTFDLASRRLRKAGYFVMSPVELMDPVARKAGMDSKDGNPAAFKKCGSTYTWGDFIAQDLRIVINMVDAIILLPDWETSKGARLEAFAAVLIGHKVFTVDPVAAELELVERTHAWVKERLLTN